MAYVCQYRLKAKDEQFDQLVKVLNDLKSSLQTIDGCIDSEILIYPGEPSDVLFVERWHSKDAHKASAGQLPEGLFPTLMNHVSGKPVIEYLESFSS